MNAKVIDLLDRIKVKDKDNERAYALGLVQSQLITGCTGWYSNVFGLWSDNAGESSYLDDIPKDKIADYLAFSLLKAWLYRFSPEEAGELNFSPPDPDILEAYMRGDFGEKDNDFLAGALVGLFIARDIARHDPDVFQATKHTKPVDSEFDEYKRRMDT